MAEPTIRRPGEGEHHERSDGYRRILVATEQISVIELGFDESLVVDPHTHPDHTDSFYVLEGELEFLENGEWERVGPGTFLSVPPNIEHGFRPCGVDFRLLNFHTPNVGFIEGLRK